MYKPHSEVPIALTMQEELL